MAESVSTVKGKQYVVKGYTESGTDKNLSVTVAAINIKEALKAAQAEFTGTHADAEVFSVVRSPAKGGPADVLVSLVSPVAITVTLDGAAKDSLVPAQITTVEGERLIFAIKDVAAGKNYTVKNKAGTTLGTTANGYIQITAARDDVLNTGSSTMTLTVEEVGGGTSADPDTSTTT